MSSPIINDQASIATPTVAVPVSSDPLNAVTPASASRAPKVHIPKHIHIFPKTPVIHLPIGKSVQCIPMSTGTPRAIGALPKYIPTKAGGLMQHLITPNISESRHSLVAHVSAFQSHKDNDDSDTSTTGDESTDSTKEARARLVLDASRAQRDVRLAEKKLADSIIAENDALGRLYRFQAEEAQKQLVDTNFSIGYIHHSIRKSGVTLSDSHPRKRRRTSDDGRVHDSDELLVPANHINDSLKLECQPTYNSEAPVDGF
ncbi:hypothetical protein P692DRAFT_20875007 [Suillus brevipes Sb2]|nr:hypothetical protein P692DRAFT_20875007 [Suillus brevipes Sb2]